MKEIKTEEAKVAPEALNEQGISLRTEGEEVVVREYQTPPGAVNGYTALYRITVKPGREVLLYRKLYREDKVVQTEGWRVEMSHSWSRPRTRVAYDYGIAESPRHIHHLHGYLDPAIYHEVEDCVLGMLRSIDPQRERQLEYLRELGWVIAEATRASRNYAMTVDAKGELRVLEAI